jgi:hypothetical protein
VPDTRATLAAPEGCSSFVDLPKPSITTLLDLRPYEGSADIHRPARGLVKLELRYDLGDEEKEHHICPKQFAEIHLGRVQEQNVWGDGRNFP